MKNAGGSAYPRGKSRTAALSDSAPEFGAARVLTHTVFTPWVPENQANPEDTYQHWLELLRGEFKASDAAAVHSQLRQYQLQSYFLQVDFGVGSIAFTRWLNNNNVKLVGSSAAAPSSLYDALAFALFGPDSELGPKLRWLAVQNMRLNQAAFLDDAKDAGRSMADFLNTHARPSAPGTPATLCALVDCLGITVQVVSFSGAGRVNFTLYEPRGGSASGAARNMVYLCATTKAGGLNTVMYDALVASMPPPAPGSKRGAAAAGLPAAAPAAAKVAAAEAAAAAYLDPPAAAAAKSAGAAAAAAP